MPWNIEQPSALKFTRWSEIFNLHRKWGSKFQGSQVAELIARDARGRFRRQLFIFRVIQFLSDTDVKLSFFILHKMFTELDNCQDEKCFDFWLPQEVSVKEGSKLES